MTDEKIEKALDDLIENDHCVMDDHDHDCDDCPLNNISVCNFDAVEHIRGIKKLAEKRLKELLSALYRRTEKPLSLERKDIVELAKDCGIKEEELK